MKQHITIDQLNELGKEEIAKLQSWYNKMPYEYVVIGMSEESQIKVRYTHPLLSIGQMIEFLGEDWHDFVIKSVEDYGDVLVPYQPEELCDKLWEACKQVLKEK